MKAEIKPNYDENRQKLADIIPLPAPFTVYIEATRVCNFKCFYCIHSTRDDKGGAFEELNYQIKHMDFDMFRGVVDQLAQFPEGSIKRIVFSGLGEPLANPKLPEMIRAIVDKQLAARVEVITNGVLLNEDLIDRLIAAGITNINISIQGLNSDEYKDVCGSRINYEEFLRNLRYLYQNKKNTKIYIKAIDANFKREEDEQKFYEIFGEFADQIFVEHLIQMQRQMVELKCKVDYTKNFYGENFNPDRKVCSPVFYFMQIGCDFDVFPCPVPGLTRGISLGNAIENKLIDIWNGKERQNFLRMMLEYKKDLIQDCKGCTNFNCIVDAAEDLDKDAGKLLSLFEEKLI